MLRVAPLLIELDSKISSTAFRFLTETSHDILDILPTAHVHRLNRSGGVNHLPV